MSMLGLYAQDAILNTPPPNAEELNTAPAPQTLHFGLSERGGMLVSKVQNLYFSQYINSLDAEFEFQLFSPLWIGLGLGYAATLPSQISEATVLIRPAWDALHGTVYLQALTAPRDGLVFRASCEAWYQKISNAELYQFYMGTEFGIGKQFQVDNMVLEPDLRVCFAFPRDVANRNTVAVTLGIRFLL